MAKYTPTIAEIMNAWRYFRTENRAYDGDPDGEVRRWLAARDAEVRGRAFAEAAGVARNYDTGYDTTAATIAEALADAAAARGVLAEEPEWEYGVRLHQTYTPSPRENMTASRLITPTTPHRTLEAAQRMAALNPSYTPTYFRRVKAGPWVPVKQEGAETDDSSSGDARSDR